MLKYMTQIEFEGNTNSKSMYINNITFFNKESNFEITIDRKKTIFTVDSDGKFVMNWNEVYVWAINGYHIFNEAPIDIDFEEFKRLIKDCSIRINYDDEAPEDYYLEITDYFM